MCAKDYTVFRRLEKEVSALAQERGLTGDPLADPVPTGRTLANLFAAGELFLDLPAELKNCDRDLARRMCKAAAFGSPQIEKHAVRPALKTPALTTAKLARERRRSAG